MRIVSGIIQRSDSFDSGWPQPGHRELLLISENRERSFRTDEVPFRTDIHLIPVKAMLRWPHCETFLMLFTEAKHLVADHL
jgi:hypothetical protein